MVKELSTAKKALRIIGAKDIKTYVLINNYGCTFRIGDRKYDTRFWANCYGYCPNEWRTSGSERGNEPYDEIDKSIMIMVDYVMNTADIDENVEVVEGE